MKRREFLVAGGAVAAAIALPARAAFPEKPMRMIIAIPPGGESDIGARQQQVVFKRLFGQDMVIESKAGAGGALAWSTLNTYPGDGYTVMGTNLPHIVLQPLEGNVQYKTDDVTNVHFYQYTPDAIIVRSESPLKTETRHTRAYRPAPDAGRTRCPGCVDRGLYHRPQALAPAGQSAGGASVAPSPARHKTAAPAPQRAPSTRQGGGARIR